MELNISQINVMSFLIKLLQLCGLCSIAYFESDGEIYDFPIKVRTSVIVK